MNSSLLRAVPQVRTLQHDLQQQKLLACIQCCQVEALPALQRKAAHNFKNKEHDLQQQKLLARMQCCQVEALPELQEERRSTSLKGKKEEPMKALGLEQLSTTCSSSRSWLSSSVARSRPSQSCRKKKHIFKRLEGGSVDKMWAAALLNVEKASKEL